MIILHLISGLGSGGAEKTLFKLVTNDKSNDHIIISFKSGGNYYEKLKNFGIKTHILDLKINTLLFLRLYKGFKLINFYQPDIIQSWMYHANFFTILIRFFNHKVRIYWNIRGSFYKNFYSYKSKIIIYFTALFSHIIPSKIIYCSRFSIEQHEKIFFLKKNPLIYLMVLV